MSGIILAATLAALVLIWRRRSWAWRPLWTDWLHERRVHSRRPAPPLVQFTTPSRPTTSPAEAERKLKLARSLLKLSTDLPRSSDMDRVLHETLRLVADEIDADRGVILLTQPDEQALLLRSAYGGNEQIPEGGRPSTFDRNQGLAGWVIQHGKAVRVDNLVQDSRWIRFEDSKNEHLSALAAPLTINQETMGAMLFLSERAQAFDDEQLPLAVAAAGQAATAIYNNELFHLIRDQATRHGGMIREKRIEASKSNAILESIAEGVLVTDPDDRIVLFNAAAERILRLERQDILGRPSAEIVGIYGEAGERWSQVMRRWSSGEDSETPMAPLDARLTLDDGRHVAVTVAPVVFENEYLGTVSTFRDVTQAVEVDRLKSEFVATVSHELRTPMTSIKGYVEMLLMETVGALTEDQKRFMRVIKSNIDRLAGLVNDLLDISRIESGRVKLTLEPVNLGDIMPELREAFLRRARIEAKPVQIEVDADEELPDVLADRDRLRQVLTNLVENSFNYTPPGGKVSLKATRLDKFLEITVADNGIGIKPEDQERVFERFFRGEQALNLSVAGTGLGLAIVRQLVEMHGGKIKLESDGMAGHGTTFRFTLPLANAEAGSE